MHGEGAAFSDRTDAVPKILSHKRFELPPFRPFKAPALRRQVARIGRVRKDLANRVLGPWLSPPPAQAAVVEPDRDRAIAVVSARVSLVHLAYHRRLIWMGD